jgi:hypothetical protein
MSVKQILLKIGRELKLDVTDPGSQACIIDDLNDVAHGLHNENDLDGTIHQVVFDLGTAPDKVVTFPWNVGTLKAMRYVNDPDNPIPISKVGINISHTSEFRAWSRIPYTEITRSSPFHTSLVGFTKLVFSVAAVQTVDILIDVEGVTSVSQTDSETVTIAAGSLTAESVNIYQDVFKITKTKLCTPDVTIKDINDNVLGVIIGRLFSPEYLKIQIDYQTSVSSRTDNNRYLEVAFKHRYLNFYKLQDSFLGTDAEDALFWKYISRKMIASDKDSAAIYSNRSKGLIKNLFMRDNPKDHKVEWTSNPAFEILNEY